MIKKGFTLAEVLITLAIIGVVATLTLPSLMTNTGEQQAKTALRKGINTLTEAGQMNLALDNYDYATAKDDADDISADALDNEMGKMSVYAILARRTQIDRTKTTGAEDSQIDLTVANVTGTDTIYFADGTALIFDKATVATQDNNAIQNDGLPLGFTVVYDTNGAKSPNILSNCLGTALGADDANDDGTAADGADCTDRTKRIIKDQFQVQLRGAVAQPWGAASRWAYDN